MSVMRQQAIEMVKRIPEDKIYYVINILANIEGLMTPPDRKTKTDSQAAYEELKQYRKKGNMDRNYKEELYAALEEKYISNIFYILRKDMPEDQRREILLRLCRILQVVGIDQMKIVSALNKRDFSDFEDCLQVECAAAMQADYIITRNVKDFTRSNITPITAEAFLNISGN